MRTAKTLIRLGGCPGWSESSLGAQPHCWFCHEAAHLTKTIHKTYDRGQSTLPQVIKFWLSKWCFDIRAESLLRLTIFRWFIQVGLFWHSSWIRISSFICQNAISTYFDIRAESFVDIIQLWVTYPSVPKRPWSEWSPKWLLVQVLKKNPVCRQTWPLLAIFVFSFYRISSHTTGRIQLNLGNYIRLTV